MEKRSLEKTENRGSGFYNNVPGEWGVKVVTQGVKVLNRGEEMGEGRV